MGQYIPDLWLPQLTPPRQPALVLELLAIVGGGRSCCMSGRFHASICWRGRLDDTKNDLGEGEPVWVSEQR